MNAEDELSDMEISDGDNGEDGDAHKMNVNHFVDDDGDAHKMNVNHFVDDDEDDDSKILSMIKQPPLISSVFEEFDISDARLVEVDGHKLKKNNLSLYRTLVVFSYNCRRKIILRDFSSAGQKDVCGGIASWEGKKLERHREECLKFARKAIAKYNCINKDGKLKLEKLIKVNIAMLTYYITFSAINRDTGKSGIYQALLRSRGVGAYVLGLFRDWSNDKILAILSITGADEDLAARRKEIIGTSKRS